MTILTFVARYLPAYKSGGPIRSISNLVACLGGEFDFRVVTSDRDTGDAAPFADTQRDTWLQVGNAQVMYLSPGARGLSALGRLLRATPYDLLYLNSFHSSDFTVKPLLLRRFRRTPQAPVLLAPRGELASSALGLKSSKKRMYRVAAQTLGLYCDVDWQASSEAEAQNIRHEMGHDITLHVGPDVYIPPPASVRRLTRMRGSVRAVTICRVSPVKNLHALATVLRDVRGSVTLDLYGVIDDADYWAKCQEAFAHLPDSISVTYRGPIEHTQVPGVLAQSDLFVLPTLGENFCHAAAEAFAAGCPVLISDQTPWRGLEEAKAGWDLPLDQPAAFSEAVQRIVGMDEYEHGEWRQGARNYITNHPLVTGAVEANRQMFLRQVSS